MPHFTSRPSTAPAGRSNWHGPASKRGTPVVLTMGGNTAVGEGGGRVTVTAGGAVGGAAVAVPLMVAVPLRLAVPVMALVGPGVAAAAVAVGRPAVAEAVACCATGCAAGALGPLAAAGSAAPRKARTVRRRKTKDDRR